MHKNIPLKGLYCNSLENCIISTEKTGIRIRSTIVGSHENNHYTIVVFRYFISENRKGMQENDKQT